MPIRFPRALTFVPYRLDHVLHFRQQRITDDPMRYLLSWIFLWVPLAVVLLCETAWFIVTIFGVSRTDSPAVLQVTFPILLLVGIIGHLAPPESRHDTDHRV